MKSKNRKSSPVKPIDWVWAVNSHCSTQSKMASVVSHHRSDKLANQSKLTNHLRSSHSRIRLKMPCQNSPERRCSSSTNVIPNRSLVEHSTMIKYATHQWLSSPTTSHIPTSLWCLSLTLLLVSTLLSPSAVLGSQQHITSVANNSTGKFEIKARVFSAIKIFALYLPQCRLPESDQYSAYGVYCSCTSFSKLFIYITRKCVHKLFKQKTKLFCI